MEAQEDEGGLIAAAVAESCRLADAPGRHAGIRRRRGSGATMCCVRGFRMPPAATARVADAPGRHAGGAGDCGSGMGSYGRRA